MAEFRAPGSFMARASFPLLVFWFGFLWIAGGASRADVIGQTMVRGVGWALLVAIVLFGDVSRWRTVKVPAVLLCCAIGLVLLQLVPLPPALWQALPGRELLSRASVVVGQPLPWRPISMSPSLTLNALGALIVPLVTLALMAHRRSEDDRRIIWLLAIVMLASALLAAFQISGGRFDHPFVNDVPGEVGGSFANRNHLAAFVALGCIVIPTLAGVHSRVRSIFLIAAFAVVLVFLLLLLAVGSRAGMVLGLVGAGLAMAVNRAAIQGRLRRLPSGRRAMIYATGALVFLGTVAASIFAERAATIDRALGSVGTEELRGQALPLVVAMIEKYLPFGSGYGTFDPVFRIDEPLQLLRIKYLNLAHNDLLQIWLDGGLLGGAILVAAIVWLARSSLRAWRGTGDIPARLASAMLLLIVLASAADYPARTPMFMALIMVCAAWLTPKASRSAQNELLVRPASANVGRNGSGLPGIPPGL